MKRNTKSVLIITSGLILTLLVTCPGTMFVFMIGGQIVRHLTGTATTGPNDGELMMDGMLSFFAMPFVLIIGTAITLWFAGLVKGKRYPPGYCIKCGYDLRGGQPGASCPECGVPNPISDQLRSKQDRDTKQNTVTHIVVWGFVYVIIVTFFGQPLMRFSSYPGTIDLLLWVPPALGIFWIMRIYHIERGAKFKHVIRLSPLYLPLIFIAGTLVGHATSYNPLPYPGGLGTVLVAAVPFVLFAVGGLSLVLYLLNRSGIGDRHLLWQIGTIIVLAVIAAYTGHIHGLSY